MRCYECRKEIPIGQGQQMGDNSYCDLCFPSVKKEETDRRDLIQYIMDTYKIPRPTGMMFGQMKKRREKYTYKNMRLTLKYAFEVVGIKPETKYGLAIIDYYHDDMLDYYRKVAYKMKHNDTIDYGQKKVVVSSPEKSDYAKNKIIDMDKFN